MEAKTPSEVFACLPGRPVTRKDFRYACFMGEREGHAFMLNPNYSCEGPYGDDQVMHVSSVMLTVWSKGQMQSKSCLLTSESELEDALRVALKEMVEACDHPHAKEMSSEEARAAGMFTGNCYHNYFCPDCGARFGVDTSD